MSQVVRWGIIGAGNIARHAIAPAIKGSSNGVLHGVASRGADRARQLAQELGAGRHYSTYEALLADPEIQAVYIGLPNGLHHEWAIACAEAGKHVLCEKSLTLTAASARAMADAFQRRGLLLQEAFMYRHHPQWEVVRGTLASGKLGPIRRISALLAGNLGDESNHRWSSSLGGGALFDVTCYSINVCRYLTAQEPIEVCAVGDFSTADGMDRTTHVSMLFPGDLCATADGSLAVAHRQEVVVHGAEGHLEMRRPFIPGREPVTLTLVRGEHREEFTVPGADHFLLQVEHFARLVAGDQTDSFPAEVGVENVAACERAFLSANGRKGSTHADSQPI